MRTLKHEKQEKKFKARATGLLTQNPDCPRTREVTEGISDLDLRVRSCSGVGGVGQDKKIGALEAAGIIWLSLTASRGKRGNSLQQCLGGDLGQNLTELLRQRKEAVMTVMEGLKEPFRGGEGIIVLKIELDKWSLRGFWKIQGAMCWR